MERSLVRGLAKDPRLFQEIMLDVRPADVARHVEIDLDEFSLKFVKLGLKNIQAEV